MALFPPIFLEILVLKFSQFGHFNKGAKVHKFQIYTDIMFFPNVETGRAPSSGIIEEKDRNSGALQNA